MSTAVRVSAAAAHMTGARKLTAVPGGDEAAAVCGVCVRAYQAVSTDASSAAKGGVDEHDVFCPLYQPSLTSKTSSPPRAAAAAAQQQQQFGREPRKREAAGGGDGTDHGVHGDHADRGDQWRWLAERTGAGAGRLAAFVEREGYVNTLGAPSHPGGSSPPSQKQQQQQQRQEQLPQQRHDYRSSSSSSSSSRRVISVPLAKNALFPSNPCHQSSAMEADTLGIALSSNYNEPQVAAEDSRATDSSGITPYFEEAAGNDPGLDGSSASSSSSLSNSSSDSFLASSESDDFPNNEPAARRTRPGKHIKSANHKRRGSKSTAGSTKKKGGSRRQHHGYVDTDDDDDDGGEAEQIATKVRRGIYLTL